MEFTEEELMNAPASESASLAPVAPAPLAGDTLLSPTEFTDEMLSGTTAPETKTFDIPAGQPRSAMDIAALPPVMPDAPPPNPQPVSTPDYSGPGYEPLIGDALGSYPTIRSVEEFAVPALTSAISTYLSGGSTAVGGGAFAATDFLNKELNKQLFGGKETAQENLSKQPGTLAYFAAAEAPAAVARLPIPLQYKVPAEMFAAMLANVMAAETAKVSENAIQGKPIEHIGGMEAGVSAGLGGGLHMITRLGTKGIQDLFAPAVLKEAADQVGKTPAQFMWDAASPIRKSIAQVMSGVDEYRKIVKQNTDPYLNKLVKSFTDIYAPEIKNVEQSKLLEYMDDVFRKEGLKASKEGLQAVRKAISTAPEGTLPLTVDVLKKQLKAAVVEDHAKQVDDLVDNIMKHFGVAKEDADRLLNANLKIGGRVDDITRQRVANFGNEVDLSKQLFGKVSQKYGKVMNKAATDFGDLGKRWDKTGISDLMVDTNATTRAAVKAAEIQGFPLKSLQGRFGPKINPVIDEILGKTVGEKVTAPRRFDIGTAKDSVEQINDVLRGSTNEAEKKIFTPIREGLITDIENALAREGKTEEASIYSFVRDRYGKAKDMGKALGIDELGRPDMLSTSDRWALDQFKNMKPGDEFHNAVSALGLEGELTKSGKLVELKRIINSAYSGGELNRKKMLGELLGSTLLPDYDKTKIKGFIKIGMPQGGVENLAGRTKTSRANLKRALKEGSPEAWAQLEKQKTQLGMSPETEARDLFWSELIEPSLVGGLDEAKVFSPEKFALLAAEKAPLLKNSKMQYVADTLLKDGSLSSNFEALKKSKEILEALGTTGNFKALDSLFLNNKKLSPRDIGYMRSVMGERAFNEMQSVVLGNIFLTPAGEPAVWKDVLPKIQQMFNPIAETGYSPSFLKSLAKEDGYTAMKNLAEKLSELDKFIQAAPDEASLSNAIGKSMLGKLLANEVGGHLAGRAMFTKKNISEINKIAYTIGGILRSKAGQITVGK